VSITTINLPNIFSSDGEIIAEVYDRCQQVAVPKISPRDQPNTSPANPISLSTGFNPKNFRGPI
jgi:hypothetical protein